MTSTLASIFKALSDANRLEILRLLARQECCVGEICRAVGRLSQPSISHHLGILRNAGLVESRRAGKEVYYTVDTEQLATCCADFFKRFGIKLEIG